MKSDPEPDASILQIVFVVADAVTLVLALAAGILAAAFTTNFILGLGAGLVVVVVLLSITAWLRRLFSVPHEHLGIVSALIDSVR